MYEGTPDHPTPVVSTNKAKAKALSSGSTTARVTSKGGPARRATSPVIDTRAWLLTRGGSPDSAPSMLRDEQTEGDAEYAREEARADRKMAILQEVMRIDPLRVFSWIRAGWLWVVLFTLLGAVAGYGIILVIKPRYTASIDLLVDPVNLKVVANDVFSDNMQRDRQLLDVDGKLRIISSGNVLSRVVSDLKLAEDPEFAPPSSNTSPAEDALVSLERRIVARRDERSFIVNVAIWTQDREKSVAIVNAVVKGFQEELAKAESEGAGRAASTLIARLDDLKKEVTTAESNVEQFKRERGLQSISGELASTLMSQQMNTQLVAAKERLIQAEARVSKLAMADPANRLDADSLQSETLTLLRAQYATLKQRVTAEAAVLGPRHPSIIALNPQIKALEQQIRAETDRITQAAKVELAQAQTALGALTAQADQARSSVFEDTTAQIQLRELEREARAKAAVYEAFMARAGEAAERQQIDTTNVRIVSPAVVPATRSFPPRGYILAGAGGMAGFCLGLMFAASLGLFRDYRRLVRIRS